VTANYHSLSQLVRFGLVGTLGAGVYFLSTALLMRYCRWSFVASASTSFVLVVAMNYVLHYSWTFRSKRPHSSAVVRFLGTSVGGMAINSGFLFLGARFATLPQSVLLLTGACLVVLWNYLVSRFWVFTESADLRH
jgi:putative flippase GtrA